MGVLLPPDISLDDEVVYDALAALDLARAQEGVDPERVFLLGHSLGGILAPRIGARDGRRPLESLSLRLPLGHSSRSFGGSWSTWRPSIETRVRRLVPTSTLSSRWWGRWRKGRFGTIRWFSALPPPIGEHWPR